MIAMVNGHLTLTDTDITTLYRLAGFDITVPGIIREVTEGRDAGLADAVDDLFDRIRKLLDACNQTVRST
jgi:hypothetical protein